MRYGRTLIFIVFVLAVSTALVAGMDSDRSNGDSFTVTYEVDPLCGSPSPDNPAVYEGGSVPLADAVPNEGYRFGSWVLEVGHRSIFGTSVEYVPIKDLSELTSYNSSVLHAYWFFLCDSVCQEGESAPATIWSDELTYVGAELENRVFYQWNVSFSDTPSVLRYGNSYMSEAPQRGTCTPVWYHHVDYLGLEDASNPNPSDYEPGTFLRLAAPVREGYLFNGWTNGSRTVTYLANQDAVLTANWEKLSVSSITYNVGKDVVFLADPVHSYYEGTVTALPDVAREGFYFNGWLTDGTIGSRIEGITSDMRGDLVLTPWWIDLDDILGHGYVLNVEQTAKQGPYVQETSETLTTRYYTYDAERGFFVVRSSVSGSVSSHWSEEGGSELEFSYLGMQEYDGRTCEVYEVSTATYYEKQYIWKGWIPLYIQSVQRSGWTTYTTVYTLQEEITFDRHGTVTVNGYGDLGILVRGSGETTVGTEIALVAEISDGIVFGGWYTSDGEFLSDSPEYTFTAYFSTDIYALNTADPDLSCNAEDEFVLPCESGLRDVVWTVCDAGGNEEHPAGPTYVFRYGGVYTVTYVGLLDDERVCGFLTVMVDGNAPIVFEWTYGHNDYSVTLQVQYSDYLRYVSDTRSRSYHDTASTLGFVTYDDRYVVQIARYIGDRTFGMDDTQRFNVLLAFVDSIQYMYDSESKGVEEYFKFPLETLYEKNGDCEDTSILFCAIASAMGYRSALLLFEGHMAASVEITDGSVDTRNPAVFTRDGISYYYCETTTSGWTVGKAPSGYTYNGTYYVYPDNEAIMPVAANYALSDIDFTGPEAVIPLTDLENAVKRSAGITLRSDEVSVTLAPETVAVLEEKGAEAVFSFARADPSELAPAQVDSIGDMPAFALALTSGGDYVQELGAPVSIVLRMDVPSGSSAKVYHVAEDGTMTQMENVRSDPDSVSFTTGHFSVYAVEIIAPEQGSGLLLPIVSVIAVLCLVGTIVRLRHSR